MLTYMTVHVCIGPEVAVGYHSLIILHFYSFLTQSSIWLGGWLVGFRVLPVFVPTSQCCGLSSDTMPNFLCGFWGSKMRSCASGTSWTEPSLQPHL